VVYPGNQLFQTAEVLSTSRKEHGGFNDQAFKDTRSDGLVRNAPGDFHPSAAAAPHYYVVANNNNSSTNSVSVYQISGTSLVSLTTVPTGGMGNGGGYFAAATQSIAHDGTNTCVFAGDAGSADISAMKVIPNRPLSKRCQ